MGTLLLRKLLIELMSTNLQLKELELACEWFAKTWNVD